MHTNRDANLALFDWDTKKWKTDQYRRQPGAEAWSIHVDINSKFFSSSGYKCINARWDLCVKDDTISFGSNIDILSDHGTPRRVILQKNMP